jgi:putative (di)nucleoside polyphosphate hydrolase
MAKPLRDNVGIALFNARGLVLLAHRYKDDGPEIIQKGFEWQMPQGGIHENENPFNAALRELYEETGVSKAAYLGETGWMTYEFPPYHGPSNHRLAPYRGQRQKWYAFRFLGNDDEIDVAIKRTDQPNEFDDWRWEQLAVLPKLVVIYKRRIYKRVAREFSSFARPVIN